MGDANKKSKNEKKKWMAQKLEKLYQTRMVNEDWEPEKKTRGSEVLKYGPTTLSIILYISLLRTFRSSEVVHSCSRWPEKEGASSGSRFLRKPRESSQPT